MTDDPDARLMDDEEAWKALRMRRHGHRTRDMRLIGLAWELLDKWARDEAVSDDDLTLLVRADVP